MKNIFKLEQILNHQQHLHYNIPYGDDIVKLVNEQIKLKKN